MFRGSKVQCSVRNGAFSGEARFSLYRFFFFEFLSLFTFVKLKNAPSNLITYNKLFRISTNKCDKSLTNLLLIQKLSKQKKYACD